MRPQYIYKKIPLFGRVAPQGRTPWPISKFFYGLLYGKLSGVNASLTLGGRPAPSLLPCSPPLPSPPYPLPSLPTSTLRSRTLNPARGSGGALLAPPAGSGSKSNLLHFSLKIRHLVAKILMILVKSQLTEKQVPGSLHSKDNIYYNVSQFIESWQHQYLLCCNFTNAPA